MIARIWRGFTTEAKGDEYYEFLQRTGLKDYRATPGNLGVTVLRRMREGKAEFLLISYWDSLDSIRKFAGSEVEKAYYYPEDKDYLLEFEPHVAHYDVLEGEEEFENLMSQISL